MISSSTDIGGAQRILGEMVRWQAHPESFDGGAIELTRKMPRRVCLARPTSCYSTFPGVRRFTSPAACVADKRK